MASPKGRVQCPVCSKSIAEFWINQHLDSNCETKKRKVETTGGPATSAPVPAKQDTGTGAAQATQAGAPGAGAPGVRARKQATLGSAFGIVEVPSYFMLVQNAGLADEFTASWVKERPDSTRWRAECKLGQRHASVVSPSPNAADDSLPGTASCTRVPLLISLLQKAVRRQDKQVAVCAAYSLLLIDTNAFLRRLPIICIEDTCLHPAFVPAVWMLIAFGKGWKPGRDHVRFLLSIVCTLCDIPRRDLPGSAETVLSDSQILKAGHSGMHTSILLTIKARLSFGGMACDMSMLRHAVNVWHERFSRGEDLNDQPLSLYAGELPVEWGPGDQHHPACAAAADFHCTNLIPQYMAMHSCDCDEEKLKSLIWDFSSSTNGRESFNTPNAQDVALWDKMASGISKIQQEIFERSFEPKIKFLTGPEDKSVKTNQ